MSRLSDVRASAPTSFARRASDVVVAGAGALMLVLSGLIARSGRVGAVERAAFRAVNGLPSALEPMLWPFMQLGNLAVGPLVAVVAAVTARYRLAAAALLVTAGKLLSERAVKAVVDRERPAAVMDDVLRRGDVPVEGQSFVSGHLVLVVGLAMVITPYLQGRWKVVPWVLAGVVGVGRIYVGAHNPLDVVGGVGLGLIVGGIANAAMGVPAGADRDRRQGPASGGRALAEGPPQAGHSASGNCECNQ